MALQWPTASSMTPMTHADDDPRRMTGIQETDVRARAEAACEALVAGDVDRLVGELSDELRRNAGEVVGLMPLPMTGASVDSIEQAGHSFVVDLRLIGETETVEVRTRWKDRGGRPTIVEASHLTRVEREPEVATSVEAGNPVETGDAV